MSVPHQKLAVSPRDILAGAWHQDGKLQNFLPERNFNWAGSARAGIRKILEVHESKKVLLPRFTCDVVLDAVRLAGAEPTFTEDDFDTIIIAHNYGFMEDPIKARNLCKKNDAILIEDCCQALGAKYDGKLAGTFGDHSVYSFSISKNIGFCGGLVDIDFRTENTFPKKVLARAILRSLFSPLVLNPLIYRTSFVKREVKSSSEPMYCDLPEYCKNVVRSISERYGSILEKRRENGDFCVEELDGVVDFIRPIKKSEPAWLYFVLLSKERDLLRKCLLKKGVDMIPLESFKDISGGTAGNDHLAFALYRKRGEIEKMISAVKEVCG